MSVQREIRMILAAATLAAIGVSAAAGATVFDGRGSTDDTPSTTRVGSTVTSVLATTSSSAGGDISGPCDEVEHADDPRCVGVASPSVTSVTSVPATTPTSTGGDISGPCDEVEHANDPRCVGGVDSSSSGRHGSVGDDSQSRSDDDHSGRGGSDDDESDDHGSDDRGSDDRSGHGRGGDSDDD